MESIFFGLQQIRAQIVLLAPSVSNGFQLVDSRYCLDRCTWCYLVFKSFAQRHKDQKCLVRRAKAFVV